jgi:hypothetical protein
MSSSELNKAAKDSIHFYWVDGILDQYGLRQDFINWSEPQLDDPLTRGWILQLIRQRYKHDDIFCYRVLTTDEDLIWIVSRENCSEEAPIFGVGNTEAEAMVAALTAT